MPSVQELILKYETFSDEELFDINSKISNYTVEAQEALKIVFEKRGGIEKITSHLDRLREIENEKLRVRNEAIRLNAFGKSEFEINMGISSSLLSEKEIIITVNSTLKELHIEKEDLSIKPRTIFGSLIGGAIGGTIGGIFWGFQMIYSNRMFAIFGFGLVLLNYGLIRLFTKQSRKNTVILVVTFISVGYALLLGQILYEIIGYRGSNPVYE